MKVNELRQRMYHLVMYNISPIQQGIQSYHAGMEYASEYWDTPEFQRWLHVDKTVVILNGGTSNVQGWAAADGLIQLGSMENNLEELLANGIPCARFNEPDLNMSTSAIAFLADETVWDVAAYPDPCNMVEPAIIFESIASKIKFMNEHKLRALTGAYGPKTAFLRMFKDRFRLA